MENNQVTQQPYRRKQSATIRLRALPDQVFELLCPVREYDWVTGWATNAVISKSGVVEPDCMFVTPGDPADGIWVTTDHDANAHQLRMYKIVPGLAVTRLDIALCVGPSGTGTDATIAYEHTALSHDGRAFVDDHDAATYSHRDGALARINRRVSRQHGALGVQTSRSTKFPCRQIGH